MSQTHSVSELAQDPISENDFNAVKVLLGRSPRGLKAISVRSLSGDPVVIQVSSLVNKKPFPTLFWLVDKLLNYAIDQIEASGYIAELQACIDQSPALQETMVEDHKVHIQLRDSLMSVSEQQDIAALGFSSVFQSRGIGGIENFTRIRCLHTYYGSHLVVPNTIGTLLDEYWQARGIYFEHLRNK